MKLKYATRTEMNECEPPQSTRQSDVVKERGKAGKSEWTTCEGTQNNGDRRTKPEKGRTFPPLHFTPTGFCLPSLICELILKELHPWPVLLRGCPPLFHATVSQLHSSEQRKGRFETEKDIWVT